MSVILHTTEGDLPIKLYYRECPRNTYNFLALCASGLYDGTIFHRNMPGVFLQGGDPSGTGKGGSSVFSSRFVEDEGFGITHLDGRGVVAMAHKGTTPNTNASQFFICYEPLLEMDGRHTIIGRVDLNKNNAAEVLTRIENKPVDKQWRFVGTPAMIQHCTVMFNPFAEGIVFLPSSMT